MTVLKPFRYIPESSSGDKTDGEVSQGDESVRVLKCKGRNCQTEATHYCKLCGEKGVFCETHSGLHLEVNDEDHTIE